MSPKRSHPSEGSSTSYHKRQKSLNILFEQIVQAADYILNGIPKIQQAVETMYPQNASDILDTLVCWGVSCDRAKDAGCNWMSRERAILDMRLPNDKRIFQVYNERYESFSQLQKLKLSCLPTPSDFAQKWGQCQSNLDARLLCLRPPDARGLPLCTLHDIFRRYLLAAQMPLPEASESAIKAMEAAAQLCASMGRSFSTKDYDSNAVPQLRDLPENARTLAFDNCIRSILDKFIRGYALNPTTDMKAETGDAYMQAARSYDLAVKVLRDRGAQAFLEQGAPMFLLCVIGPWLLVAGGFHDGKNVIVEPLGDVCIMFEDYTNGRPEKLARVLHALSNHVDELKELAIQKRSSPIFPPFTPRIYTSCVLYTPSEAHTQGRLTFADKLDFKNCNRLLFSASLFIAISAEPIPVFVKLVSGKYGEDVHHLLAKHDLAPTLHAYSHPEGAPRAYVMEYLQSSSWKTLYDYSSLPNASTPKDLINRSITKVLYVLKKNGKVHGDLRSLNVMVNVSETGETIRVAGGSGKSRANIKVVDFDWAGDAGRVYYPALRNADICWPGNPAGPIEEDHDCLLVRGGLG
ncbi:hypothetical protein BU17DRAFT_79150 [Hysterangium stoloniferum]|nr:hypothetical protein BU17DRAFT_79150 [Hysterangium stoloniferum]